MCRFATHVACADVRARASPLELQLRLVHSQGLHDFEPGFVLRTIWYF